MSQTARFARTTPDVVYVVKMQDGISKAEAWMVVVRPLLQIGFVLFASSICNADIS